MSNGFDAAVLKRFVGEIDKFKEAMASRQGEYMKFCRDQRELISGVFDRAKDAGIPRVELRAVLKERDLQKKIENLREELEEDQAETFDQIKHALGMLSDLPLGEVALRNSDAVDSLTDDDGDGAATADVAASKANAKALRAGVKQLN